MSKIPKSNKLMIGSRAEKYDRPHICNKTVPSPELKFMIESK